MMSKIFTLVFAVLFFTLTTSTSALYQPWIAEQAARKAYNDKKATYNPADQKKLDDLSAQIVAINKRRTDELSLQTEAQGAILDEFQSRVQSESGDQIDKARYWLTYAHEAVAFQAAKNYIFDLNSQVNLKKDVTSTVSQFENDLSALRKKVINSQQMIQELVKGGS